MVAHPAFASPQFPSAVDFGRPRRSAYLELFPWEGVYDSYLVYSWGEHEGIGSLYGFAG